MQVIQNPARSEWPGLAERPTQDHAHLENTVQDILDAVHTGGDAALKELTRKFDGVELANLLVTEDELARSERQVSDAIKQAVAQAKSNIERFALLGRRGDGHIETMPGVACWEHTVPIERVGLYVPGGSAPLLSTVLMLGIPATIAGCREIVLCTPPNKDGSIDPAILYCCQILGLRKIIRCGGAQAIAALALGTESVPKVDKIFGPGNSYVTAAKQLVQRLGVAIDMPAGPSEVLIIADQQANPKFVAADLLAQAEHGPDSQVLLLSTSQELVAAVNVELEQQLKQLPRAEIAKKALENSRAIFLNKVHECLEFSNLYAPEHLILNLAHPEEASSLIRNAGSVFIGQYTPEAAGDYASGPNHTLPTGGHARCLSGVSLDSFLKRITFQTISAEGLRLIAPTVETLAEAEGLTAHRLAVSLRVEQLNSVCE